MICTVGPGVVGRGAHLGGGTAWLALTAISAVLGLAVGYLAYLGYRRQQSLPMLFVGTGFLLAFAAPAALVGGYLALDAVVAFTPELEPRLAGAVSLASEGIRIVGLSFVLYGLWRPGRERARRETERTVPERERESE